MQTMLRHWTLLRTVPRLPRKMNAATLTSRLESEGFGISKRTVERDLRNLSALFPLVCDEAAQGQGWSWMREADPFDVPGMDPETALTFEILERFAGHLLPRSVLRRLDPQFRQADQVLQQLSPTAGPRAWPERVRVLPRTIDLIAPQVREDIVEVIYRALLEGYRLTGDYRPRTEGGDSVRTYEINPLGIVFRDQVAYLVCTLWNYERIVQLALHRFEWAALTGRGQSEPDDFDLDEYIAQGHLHVRESGDTLRLRVRFAAEAAYHLQETPLSRDQQLSRVGEQTTELTATVADTAQLRWWLLGFGPSAEVIEPAALRGEFRQLIGRMASAYGVGASEAVGEGVSA